MNFLEDIGPEVIHGYEVCHSLVLFVSLHAESVVFSARCVH